MPSCQSKSAHPRSRALRRLAGPVSAWSSSWEPSVLLADKQDLEFGLKLSNTFPVDTTRGELPNEEMYMSGRSLFPLTIEMCNRISRQFSGKMRISFAGGADYFNCDKLFAAGIWPITVAPPS